MKIGLVRHFEVVTGLPEKKWLNPKEFNDWFARYDMAEVKEKSVDLGGIAWQRCFSSDLPRALKTAQRIYGGDIIATGMLREMTVRAVMNRDIRLPFSVWKLLVRLAWYSSHRSLLENKRQFLGNVKRFAHDILPRGDGNTLVVGHGGFMLFLRKELMRQGFTGPKFTIPENGKLYIFEKASGAVQ